MRLWSLFIQYANDNPLTGHLRRMKMLQRMLEVMYCQRYTEMFGTTAKIAPQYNPESVGWQDYYTSVVKTGYMLRVDLMGLIPWS